MPVEISISEMRLNTSCGRLRPTADSSSGGWIQVAADLCPRLTGILAAGYEWQLRLIYPVADSSSGGLIRVAADSVLRLTRVRPAGLDLRLFYTLTYQVNLRTYSAKYIIFMVCFLLSDLSYHWFRSSCCFKNLEEAWRSLRKLEEKLQDSSCDWF